MNKLDVRQRLRIPAALADFLDEVVVEQALETRQEAILKILRDAKRKRCHAVIQAELRHRRRKEQSVGQTGSRARP